MRQFMVSFHGSVGLRQQIGDSPGPRGRIHMQSLGTRELGFREGIQYRGVKQRLQMGSRKQRNEEKLCF
jgi:hypothetical protein